MKRAQQALDPFHRPLRRRGGPPPDDDTPYLEQRVVITDEALWDDAGFAVNDARADVDAKTARGR